MTEKRIQFSNIVKSQVPTYVANDFPLISEFLEQYYLSQEFKSAPIDLIQNIDQYISLNEQTSLNHSIVLEGDIDEFATTINIDVGSSPQGTQKFPDTYGLLKIDDEIITYTGKTQYSFTGCIRGFVGISSYKSDSNPENLVFESTAAAEHKDEATIENLTCSFLTEFLKKTKIQLLPGLSDRALYSGLDQNKFIKQAKDFYSSKGTDESFKILFKALYGEDIKIIRPKEYLLTPSNGQNLVTSNFVVEGISGDPSTLELKTVFQDYPAKAYTPIYGVEEIKVGAGKTYYRLSFDGGYNRDSRVLGATYGNFKVSPKTHVIGNVSAGSTYIDVDSTVGFETSGNLFVRYPTSTSSPTGIVSYTSKTLTQFLGCTNIDDTIVDGDSIGISSFVYNKPYTDDLGVEVRVGSVLTGFSKPEEVHDYKIEDNFKVKSIGVKNTGFKFKNWIYSNPVQYTIDKIELISTTSPQTYRLTLKTEHQLRQGDDLFINTINGVDSFDCTISDIITSKVVLITTTGSIVTGGQYYLRKKINKVNSLQFSFLTKFQANVQNTYKKKYSNSLLVASNSLPSYATQPIVTGKKQNILNGTFTGSTFKVLNHGFYTGDIVYYTPEKSTVTYTVDGVEQVQTTIISSLFGGDDGGEGVYYVKRVDSSNIKLAKSLANIYFSKFETLDGSPTVNNNILEPFGITGKNLQPQKIYREVSTPIETFAPEETAAGPTGVLVNGVEVLNYKSDDLIYYGNIENIEITAPGSGFDIINSPKLMISDAVGTGATGSLAISGSLREIQILDRGFDYVENPTISITGGNGSNAKASASLKLVNHEVEFFSDPQSERVGLGATLSTIGFSTYHKFRSGEEVIYKPDGQQGVGGLSTDAVYYASIVNPTTIKLHTNLDDAVVGINTVTLSFYGIGKHRLETVNKKAVIDAINVTDNGSGYETKRRSVGISGISTALNEITIKNHGYSSGEILRYSVGTGDVVSGLVDGNDYYVTKLNDDVFKLSEIGTTTQGKEFFYTTNQYVDLTSKGTGIQYFNYQPISVTVNGAVGISSVGTETFKAQVQPIFRGELTSIHLDDSGVGYGDSEIINFNRRPSVSILSGQNAQVTPIVTADGRIIEVIVSNVGSQYTSTPDLVINGTGVGCVLTPIIENGILSEVKVLDPGAGYDPDDTSIDVITTETRAEFNPVLKTWRFNLFEKLYQNNELKDDDVVISPSSSQKYELQCYHMYAPRKLREILFSVAEGGETLFGVPDLKIINSKETEDTDHSPIIGWAYDGNPIYGPYGYSESDGGIVTIMKSSYKLNSLRLNGPPTSIYPLGFFIEDYSYYENNDESYLDENNGRFCITPDYPNGTYAYFATVNSGNTASSGIFNNFKTPQFPYLIGDKYNSTPIKFNFENSSNQDDYDLNDKDWCRNTFPYNLNDPDVDYPYIYVPNKLQQTGTVTSTRRGGIKGLEIKNGGNLYKIGDEVSFLDAGTTGFGAAARVSLIDGKEITSLTSTENKVSNVEFLPAKEKGFYNVEVSSPHSFQNLDIVTVSGLSTTSSGVEGSYTIGVSSESFRMVGTGTTGVSVGATTVTGIVTFFAIRGGDLENSSIVPNDILGIGTEQVRVLNVDKLNSRFRVLRAINGVGGIHTIGSVLTEVPRRFSINAGFKTTYNFNRNKGIYFDPGESVGLGTGTVVGSGHTITFAYPGAGVTQIFIPTKSVFIKGHGLKTGDSLTYSANGGDGIEYNEQGSVGVAKTLTDGQTLFVAKISDDLIGIATVRVGLGTDGFIGVGNTSRTLFLTDVGSGTIHSFDTNYANLTGDAIKRVVTATTSENHGLRVNHDVFMDVNPSVDTTYKVKYNSANKRMLVGINTFASVGVNSTSNTFTITDHGYVSGDKIIHSATTPCEGLSNDKIYYAVKVDNDKFKLSDTHYGATRPKPDIVDIQSTSSGEFGLINPPISAYRSSNVVFDVSDSSLSYVKQTTSYSAFRLNLYLDENCTSEWKSDKSSSTFSLNRIGVPGISSDAKVTVAIGQTTPQTLYYKFDPVTDNDLSEDQLKIAIDTEVLGNNQLQSKDSVYNGKRRVAIAGTNFFTFSLPEIPEKTSYVSTASSIRYTTDCTHAEGPIAKIDVTSTGKNYNILPEVSSITSNNGIGADIIATSDTIGQIEKIKINDIGYDFPTDNTLKPSATLPQIVKVDSFATFDSIGITSAGRGYTSSPKLLAFDGKTGSLITDLDVRYDLGDTEVTIVRNTKGINNTIPSILPIRNSNGVGISTVGFNTVTKDVTVTMSVGFSTSFPFEVDDRVMIENISVGVGSTARGYNSENYNYKLFTLTGVTPNIGGIGSVTYNIANDLEDGEIPGTFDDINSSGMITPEKFFPVFDPIIGVGNYLPGEKVTTNGKEGTVQSWDRGTKTLRVLSLDDFTVGEKLRGLTSELIGTASSVTSYECYFDVGPSTDIFEGNQTYSGRLNDNLQRLQDNFYYQNFSYSLKSRIPYDNWNDVVSSVNHTLGYRKFSDLQIETVNEQGLRVGLSTELTDVSIVSDLDGFVDTNCVFDFDIARENNLDFNIDNGILSDEIIFENKILSDFTESVGNRVLSIDDLGPQFNSNPRATAFTVVTTFPLSDFRFRKYITYLKDTRFNQERQLMIVDVIHDNSVGYINQYARVETVYDQGSFDFAISGSDGQLQFFPVNSSVNDYDITSISYNLNDNYLSTGSTSIGGVLIDSESVIVSSGTTANIVSIGDTYHSAKVLVTIAPDVSNPSFGNTSTFNSNDFEAQELNIVHDGTDVSILEFGKLTTNAGGTSAVGFGTYTARLDGGQIKVDFIPSSGIATTGVINTVVVGLSSSSTGTTNLDLKHARLESRVTSISSSGSPTENVVGTYPSHISQDNDRYDTAHFLVQVHDTTNNRYEFLEYIIVDDHVQGVATYDTYDTEFGNIETHSGLGTFGSRVNVVGLAATTELLFTPIAGIDATVHVYMNALRLEDDTKDVLSLVNSTIETGFAEYTGTNRDVKRAFTLTHKNEPIFERYFLGNDSSIVSVDGNTIKIPNHFFVSGEELKYHHAGVGNTQAIEIANTTFPATGVTTEKLPTSGVFAVKLNDNEIQLASSASNALLSIPQVLDITSVGIGTSHRFVSTNQNPKVLVALDNLIQSPLVSTAVTSSLASNVVSTDDIIEFTGISSFFGGDLVKIGEEVMLVEGVGIGSTNFVRVRRQWMGTPLTGIDTGATITKVVGNYNIVDNTLNFVEAPYGNTPLGTSTNAPDERDYQGISTSSTFQGRTFLRNAAPNSTNETYSKNYIFDDISDEFTGVEREFTLTANGSNVLGISNEGAIVLVNDIFQVSGAENNYELSENTGITSISFVGSGRTTQSAFVESMGRDVGVSTFPRGGMIVSVGSQAGLGYQPLVAAGGTATVSAAGTITSVSIGNSGSGYRSGIQTNVSVGVQLPDIVGSTVIPIGVASVSDGHVTSVAITTDRVFYAPRDISNVGYSHTTGVTTVTTSTAHGLSVQDEIIVSGIAFTCDYAKALPVNITNVGYSSITGIMTVTTSGPHNLNTSGQRSDVLLTGIGMTCDLDNGGSTHVYPRTTDPAYCGTPVLSTPTANTFTVNVGTSTVATYYQSGGVAQPVLIAPRLNNNSASGFDPASQGSTVLRVIDSTSFEINSGISTRAHFYARCGTVKKPIDIVIDPPSSYSGVPLVYSSSSSGIGSGAAIDIVVGQGSSVIDFSLSNTGYGYGNTQTLTVSVGGTTGIPTTSSFTTANEFQIEIEKVISDEFTGWSVGVLETLDNVNRFIDGARLDFPLLRGGTPISIMKGKGSKIELDHLLLIFVNSILQKPRISYEFDGGSFITFKEAPKSGDDIKIVFYKGGGDALDVVDREVLETIKYGDEVTLNYDQERGQKSYLQENARTISTVTSIDAVNTLPYYGPGNTTDTTLERPITWCRQTQDKIINGQEVGKDREIYEPVINPTANIISSVSIGSTIIYVDRLRPMFNLQNENIDASFRDGIQKKVTFVSPTVTVAAAATAVVSTAGTVSSIVLSTGGVGYSTTPEVSIGIASTDTSTRATATATISGGVITGISISNPGTEYTSSNPPGVLIAPPVQETETNTVSSYEGDSGIIVGLGTTAVGVGTTQMIFDLHIPYDSVMRQTNIVGTAVTLSTLGVNDYFTVRNSNIGVADTSITSLYSDNSTVIGIGTEFCDNVYAVDSVELVSRSVAGVNTTVKRVFANVTNAPTGIVGIVTSPGFGDYSWGKVTLTGRTKSLSYPANTMSGIGTNGVTGISTSTKLVRTRYVRFKKFSS